jgi:hypothetical protein
MESAVPFKMITDKRVTIRDEDEKVIPRSLFDRGDKRFNGLLG